MRWNAAAVCNAIQEYRLEVLEARHVPALDKAFRRIVDLGNCLVIGVAFLMWGELIEAEWSLYASVN